MGITNMVWWNSIFTMTIQNRSSLRNLGMPPLQSNFAFKYLNVHHWLYEKVLIYISSWISKENYILKCIPSLSIFTLNCNIEFFLINLTCHYLFLRLCKLQVVIMCEVWIKPEFLESTCYIFWLFWILRWASHET